MTMIGPGRAWLPTGRSRRSGGAVAVNDILPPVLPGQPVRAAFTCHDARPLTTLYQPQSPHRPRWLCAVRRVDARGRVIYSCLPSDRSNHELLPLAPENRSVYGGETGRFSSEASMTTKPTRAVG
ncbi:hypothetical protein [Nocardia barduliensis]|uniref:hypothetical protein n=1 Tax=Nocardia barduliensis TaxID=2736643 RepID=UPI0015737C9B|nr:hypothetical protein [Nocardia barduliensis]